MKQQPFMTRLNARRTGQVSVDEVSVDVMIDSAGLRDVDLELQRDLDAVVLPLAQLESDPEQVRKTFEDIEALAENIATIGQQHAVVVKEIAPGRYQLIDGERRFRALKLLQRKDPQGFGSVRAWVNRHAFIDDDIDKKIVQLSANEQRSAVPALELAQEYRRIMTAKGWKQRQLAVAIGKSEATVSKTLKLLSLSFEDQQRLDSGALSARTVKERAIRKAGTVALDKSRTSTVAVPMAVVDTLAQLLRVLAELHDLPAVELPARPTKKALLAVLENRAPGVLAAVRAHA